MIFLGESNLPVIFAGHEEVHLPEVELHHIVRHHLAVPELEDAVPGAGPRLAVQEDEDVKVHPEVLLEVDKICGKPTHPN